MTAPRALLLSSSRVPDRDEYLTWAAEEIRDFLDGVRTVTFVPFAGVTKTDACLAPAPVVSRIISPALVHACTNSTAVTRVVI